LKACLLYAHSLGGRCPAVPAVKFDLLLPRLASTNAFFHRYGEVKTPGILEIESPRKVWPGSSDFYF
jgi:hypothetical protein